MQCGKYEMKKFVVEKTGSFYISISYLEFRGEARGDFPGVLRINGLVPILDLRGSGGAKCDPLLCPALPELEYELSGLYRFNESLRASGVVAL